SSCTIPATGTVAQPATRSAARTAQRWRALTTRRVHMRPGLPTMAQGEHRAACGVQIVSAQKEGVWNVVDTRAASGRQGGFRSLHGPLSAIARTRTLRKATGP